ncbi:MAG: hypothetical protein ABR595_06940 [Psychroflexus sp.]
MKILKFLSLIAISTAFIACSSDDDLNNDGENLGPKANLQILATTNAQTAGRSVQKANNLEIESFMINIKKIEFEYAETSGRPSSTSSDSDDSDHISFDELPSEIQNYLAENYANDPFCKAELEDDLDDPYRYEVELQSGLEIYFREDFSVYATEQDDSNCDEDDDDYNDDSSYGSDDEFDLNGPFELNLTGGSVTVTEVEIPVGEYEEVEFEMDRSSDPTSPLYQKSMLLTGSINGTPFEFYHTFDEDFEVDYEDAGQNLIIDENNNNAVTFNFDLNAVINAVDMSNAADGNGNGTIEISPVDDDGNNALANQIKNAIKDYVDLLDD